MRGGGQTSYPKPINKGLVPLIKKIVAWNNIFLFPKSKVDRHIGYLLLTPQLSFGEMTLKSKEETGSSNSFMSFFVGQTDRQNVFFYIWFAYLDILNDSVNENDRQILNGRRN